MLGHPTQVLGADGQTGKVNVTILHKSEQANATC